MHAANAQREYRGDDEVSHSHDAQGSGGEGSYSAGELANCIHEQHRSDDRSGNQQMNKHEACNGPGNLTQQRSRGNGLQCRAFVTGVARGRGFGWGFCGQRKREDFRHKSA